MIDLSSSQGFVASILKELLNRFDVFSIDNRLGSIKGQIRKAAVNRP